MATKIALFVGTLGGGGAERAMLDIARGLAQRGFVVDLVLMRAEGPYLEDVPNCVRVVDLNATARLATLAGLTGYLRRRATEPPAVDPAIGQCRRVARPHPCRSAARRHRAAC